MNKYWKADLGLGYKGVDYNIGPTPDDIVVNLYNEQDYSITPIWNVIGVINGTMSDEVVIIGNHRDAWIAGGAGDPNSGSAVLNEVVRSFGEALAKGWKPLRTVVFASWDGEEYGLIGSTEWVEEYLPWLSHTNVAYLNLDVAVSGHNFGVAAAPLLNQLLFDITKQVKSPNQTVKGQTVHDLWDGRIRTMGSGSDFTAFQDYAGVPSLDIGFKGGAGDPVYHYHSNYDSFHWMDTFGDPNFAYHRATAQLLGLLIARLADEPLVALRAGDYADALQGYVDRIEAKLKGEKAPDDDKKHAAELRGVRTGTREQLVAEGHGPGKAGVAVALARLHHAVWDFKTHAVALDAKADALRAEAARQLPWWRWPAKLKLGLQIRVANAKYKQIERHFLHEEGLDGRSWFKHVVFAPGLWTGYAGGKSSHWGLL
jgi:N-acetylated-alpha-linked acidic dipeptidase